MKIIKQGGVGLIEIMISIVVGLFLVFGLTTVLVDSSKSYNIQNDLARLQENARFAIEFMARDIRMAGYFGCVVSSRVTNILSNSGGDIFDVSNPIEGFEQDQAQWKPSSSIDAINLVNSNTDAITLRFAVPGSRAPIQSAMTNLYDAVAVSSPSPFSVDSIVTVGDCDAADVFQITAINNGALAHGTGTTPGNADVNLSRLYQGSAATSVMSLRSVRYFIADNADGVPTLRREIINDGGTVTYSEDVVEGIENLQFLYGEDTDGDSAPNSYVEAHAVGNWRNLVTVQVGVLARSIERYGTDIDNNSGAHTILNYNFVDTANLNIQRRTLSTTIALRNI